MSKSDHSKSRFDRFNDGDRITRRHMLVDTRTAIEDSLTDAVLPVRRVTLAEHIEHPLRTLSYTSESPAVSEPMPAWERELLGWDAEHLSDCEYGCKIYDGVLEHSFVYGCPQADPKPEPKPVIEHLPTSDRKVDSWSATHERAVQRRNRVSYGFDRITASDLMNTNRRNIASIPMDV